MSRWARLYGGANRALVRDAKCTVIKKDYESARTMAETVIDAWSIADAPVPSVAEMRALIARLPAVKAAPR